MSTNNWLVAIFTFGEGWHNNHHAHPTSARHGLTWYEVDLNWYGIWFLKLFGLARQIKVVDLDELARKEAPARNGTLVTAAVDAAPSVAGD
jgi:stearoyl-CoA desaturase (delta-9 desaturase)